MRLRKLNKGSYKGFTIIELIVVIAVIAILATISIVGYGAWRNQTSATQVKNDLTNVASAMENARTFGSAYPTTIPTTVTASNNVVLVGGGSVDGKSYCVDGTTTLNSSIMYYVDSISKGPQQGTCIGRITVPIPDIPTGLAILSATGTLITLSWNPASYAASYTVQCATDPAYVVGLQSTTTAGLTASFSSLAQVTTYNCRIKATNAVGESAWSVTINSNTTTTSPSAPTGLAVATASTSQLNYSWSSAANSTSYNIQRATNSGFTTGVVTVNQSSVTGFSIGLTSGTTYYYRVQGVNAGGGGAYSSPIINASTLPAAPSGVGISGVTSSQATISWSAVTGAINYTLEYATNSSFTASTAITGISPTSQTVTGLYQGQIYYFRVSAIGSAGTSAVSSSVNGTTPIAQPLQALGGVSQFSPAISHWANNQNVVVNWVTYCPTNPTTPISVYNANFTSYDWPPPPINAYYHGFGFTDYWYTSQSGPTVTYNARYQCTNGYGTSAASSDNVTYITIN
jgi:prepilin-type N-terminal cleavage/methylation domain-containing protein